MNLRQFKWGLHTYMIAIEGDKMQKAVVLSAATIKSICSSQEHRPTKTMALSIQAYMMTQDFKDHVLWPIYLQV